MKGFGGKNQSKQIKKNEEILNIDQLINKTFKLQLKETEAAKYYDISLKME